MTLSRKELVALAATLPITLVEVKQIHDALEGPVPNELLLKAIQASVELAYFYNWSLTHATTIIGSRYMDEHPDD